MAGARCPRCGGPREDRQPDPLSRCAYCGALLAALEPARRLEARPRLDAAAARRRVARTLLRRGERGWRTLEPRPVVYPLLRQADPRHPYQPLAPLPPALTGRWRPSGADLVIDENWAAAGSCASRVPISIEPPAGASVVFYPFFRVPLSRGDEETAAWVDAVDAQVILPGELGQGAGDDHRGLERALTVGLAGGTGAGLLLPLPLSAVAATMLGAWLWWRAERW
ncbi:MAG: hypothetical protein Q9Q40_11900 [Acidobacteriota bacterium]|nr:hypothetical protein [Acidobacteriota bacterium]MDQ7087152.1 hypothetical protein [Acidobacteriota bacterium]